MATAFVGGSVWPSADARASEDEFQLGTARDDRESQEEIDVVEVRGERRTPSLSPAPDRAIALGSRFARQETLGDVLSELAGISVLRSGAAGSVQLLSVRGADFDQTQLLIDDVPIVGPDRGAVDFGLFPIDGFERAELYTFSAPIRYGIGNIGGTIRLVPREGDRSSARVRGSAGSFGTYRAEGEAQTQLGPFSMTLAGGYLRADNDFEYLDNNSTFAIESDDTLRRRQNAGVDQANGFGYLTWEEGAHRVALLGLLIHQDRGVPGPATVQSLESEQERTRAFGSLGYRYRGDLLGLPLNAFATLGAGRDEDRFVDRLARVGLGQEDTRDRYDSLDGRAGVFADVLPFLTLGAVGTVRWDELAPNNTFASPPEEPSERRASVLAAESLLHGDLGELAWKLRASVASQDVVAVLSESRLQGIFETRSDRRDELYRVEAEFGWAEFLALSAKFTTGLDYPTTLQLFGNRNTIVGNVELQPERSSAYDVTAEVKSGIGAFGFDVEVSAFSLDVEDIIVARRSSRGTVSFLNEEEGHTRGLEVAAELLWADWLRSTTALTLQDPEFDNRDFERAQPLRVPRRVFHRLGAMASFAGPISSIVAFGELDHRSSFFADSANLVEQPSFTTVNTGLQLASSLNVSFAFSVRNLFDRRGLDLLAFPRPGRSFELSLEWLAPV